MKVRDFFNKWDYNDRCARNFEGILPYLKGDLNESDKVLNEEKYHYIPNANHPEDIGAESIYNSETNTDVIMMLNELKMYFDEAAGDVEEVIRTATHDPGVGKADVEMLKFGSAKIQEIIDKMHSTWENY